uniref:carbohydrate sulfotransferase 11-like n=1 Tax=Ciona intestinalis TaxID=7719 RepID=UPI000EF4E848|nr:carbohydrate sulfotransferase 11-like [Ciona intestinalis]|eukprot:XP_002121276.4 carbohydrate sulfotransferase 11-like [Ciona intestinalis]
MEGVNSDIWENLIVSLEEGAGKDYLDLRFAGGPTKRLLWQYNENSIRYRVENYFKFTFVREPLSRLVGNFHNYLSPDDITKLHDNYLQLSRDIRRRYDPDLFYSIVRRNNTKFARMNEFVKYLVDPPTGLLGAKRTLFQTYNELCSPCNVPYDFIGREENMGDDVGYILRRIKAQKLKFPFDKLQKPTGNYDKELEDAVSEDLVKKLVEKYQVDYSLFGYPNPWQEVP